MLEEGTSFSAQERAPGHEVATKPRLRPRRITLVLPRSAAAPGLEPAVRELTARGHRVDLAFVSAGSAKAAPEEGQRLAATVTRVRATPVRERRDDWTPLSLALRGLQSSGRAAAWISRAIPTSPLIDQELTLRFPDVVMVAAAPPLPFEWLRSARRVGIRTAVLAIDWDGFEAAEPALTPVDRAFVLDAAQQRAAIERQRLSASAVTAVGAYAYDAWLERRPERGRAEFLAALGLPPDRLVVLYTGERDPRRFGDWLSALRGSRHATLRAASVLVSPGDAADDPAVRVLEGDRFEAVFHADAIVALDPQSAAEAAILGRPVIAPSDHERLAQALADPAPSGRRPESPAAALADAVETLLEQPWPAPTGPRATELAARPLLWLLSCSPLMPKVKGLRRSARGQRAAAALAPLAPTLRRARGLRGRSA